MKIIEFTGKESGYEKEEAQINRIEQAIILWAKRNNLLDIWFFKNVNYYHEGFGVEWNKNYWNGEVDLLFISKNHFIIFELKNKKGIVEGQTHKGNWKIKYYDKDIFIEEKDYFTQCSKMKVFFTNNYWQKKIKSKVNNEHKLRPDVLLVFLDGSDTSNIFYSPPVRFRKDEYYNILEKLNNEDKIFMESNFHYEKKRNIININFNDGLIDLERLKKILLFCNYNERVSKWFHVITESEIKYLLPKLGSDSFEINEEIINIMARDFKLTISREYCI